MRVSAKAEYACRAVLELTNYYNKTDVIHINDIANQQSIPEKYLVQILLQLQRSGLVRSKRGASGDVIRAMDGELISVESLSNDEEISKQQTGKYVLKDIWSEVQIKLTTIMDNITFAEISKRSQKKLSMYYI